jgi:hypothetical protein
MTKTKAIKILEALIAINTGAIRRVAMKRPLQPSERAAAVQILRDDNTALTLAIQCIKKVKALNA